MRQASTAVEHYYKPSEAPRRATQAEKILAFLEQCGRAMTMGEIARAINVPDSTASARLNAMRPHKVDVYGERKCSITGNVRQTWFVSPPQREMFGRKS